MTRQVGHILHDMLEAIGRIEEVTAGKTFYDYEANWKLRYIVERAIEIISEASRALPDEMKQEFPHIEWVAIRNIGNVLRHQYDGISSDLIWGVVTDELPALRATIEAIDRGHAK